MPIIVENLVKSFAGTPVLRSITQTFADAEISVLLGASGCGKTTMLRCIAGLERPNGGRIALGERTLGERTVYRDDPALWVPVERRKLAMVFQSYAIWPHMTVFQNVSLPLRASRVARPESRARVMAALDVVGLAPFAERSATRLSGGQQQRVALARCIVSGSPVILMDEPLSNLDANLRIAMRSEIRDIQRRLGQTILFVTHDQEEAMSIADTIYLMRDGHVIQKGTPEDIYEHPQSRFAAEFLGRANIIEAFERGAGANGAEVRLGDLVLPAPAGLSGAPSVLCIRPEKWRIGAPQAAGVLRGRIAQTRYIGDRRELTIDTPVGRIAVVEIAGATRTVGDAVGLTVGAGDVRALT